MNHGIGYSWTNNNTESANHVLKVATHWKSKSLPDLINILENVVKNQERDMRRAIIGQGNFRLAASMQHHQLTPSQWSALSIDKKIKKF